MASSSAAKAKHIHASVHPEGQLIVHSSSGRICYERPRFNVILVQLSGKEQPEMGGLFFSLLEHELAFDQRRRPRDGPRDIVELFVDAQRVPQHGLMFESWIRFLMARERRLRRLHILATNKVISLSVQIIQHLSGTGDLVRLYQAPAAFHAAHRTLLAPDMGVTQSRNAVGRLRRHLTLLPSPLPSLTSVNVWQQKQPGTNGSIVGNGSDLPYDGPPVRDGAYDAQ